MKKLILAFTLLLAITINAQAQNCGCLQVKNFTSSCNNATKGRLFTVTLTVEAATGTTIEIATENGTIDGAASKSFTHTPPQTDIQFAFAETTVKPQITYTVTIKDSRGNIICKEKRSTDLLAICGVDCNAGWVTLNTPPQCTHIDGCTATNKDSILGVHGALMAGPKKVKSYTTTVSSIQRRSSCSGQAKGAWTTVTLDAVNNADLQGLGATTVTTTKVTMGGFNNATDYFLYLKMPKQKLMPRCADEYRFVITVEVIFEDGCKASTSNTINYIWK
jgi:hypothetical protein